MATTATQSSILVATPAPTTLPTIYRAGDIIIMNPQETCVIFVAVILFSAFLEYFLQRISNVENRYARVLVTTMSQEITIVGVLALFLMFSVSVVPQRLMKPLFVQLFNWANISLFFLALMFVFVIVVQFVWCSLETRYVWKTFEEGALETEELEKLKYPHRIFKQVHELYRQELLSKSGLPTSSVPFNEYTALIWRRSLVRCSNLTFRTWFFLSFVILLNLVRIIFIPWADGLSGDDRAFFNQLTLMGIVGWGMFLSYLFFFFMMQWRLSRLASGKITLSKDEPAANFIPCGTLKRGIEYIQVLIFSYNWYVVLFITGGYRQVVDLEQGWQKAVLMIMFFLPMVIFLVTMPWFFHSMAMLQVIGNVNAKMVLNIFRRIRGEGEDDDDDDNDDEPDDEAEAQLELIARALKTGAGAASSDKGSLRGGGKPKARGAMSGKGSETASASGGGGGGGRAGGGGGDDRDRPTWAEDDDDWDGNTTLAFGERRNEMEKRKAGTLFVNNVDADRVRKQIAAEFEAERAAIEAANAPPPEAPKEEPAAAAAAGGSPTTKAKPGAKMKAAARVVALTAAQKKKIDEQARKELEKRKKEMAEKKKQEGPKRKRPEFLDSDEDWDDETGLLVKGDAGGGPSAAAASGRGDDDGL